MVADDLPVIWLQVNYKFISYGTCILFSNGVCCTASTARLWTNRFEEFYIIYL